MDNYTYAHKREGSKVCASPPPPPIRAGSQLSTPPPRLLHSTPSPQNSPSNSIRVQRPRSSQKNRIDDEEKIKRSRAWANAYELSQDLHDKQLEMLERKYGGQLRARRAARIIQQAYRKHKLSKNFEKLRCEVEEKRLSRRLTEFGRSKTIWSDMVASVENSMQPHGSSIHVRHYTDSSLLADSQFLSHSHEDQLNQNSPNLSSGSVRTIRIMQKSHSVSVATKETFVTRERRPLQQNLGLDLNPITEAKVKAEEDNNNRSSFGEMNDSSASDSPQDTPVEPTVDLPSVNFENLLESKETDILNDSFHSDSSHDSHRQSAAESGAATLVPAEEYALCEKCRNPMTDSISSTEDLLLSPDTERTPTQEDACVVTKIYANTEVRLRKRKCAHCGKHSPEPSPIWKRKSHVMSSSSSFSDDIKRMSNISEASEPDSLTASREGLSTSSSDTASLGSGGLTYHPHSMSLSTGAASSPQAPLPPKLSDRQRKRAYRIGLNLFNKKPEKGIKFLIEQRFVENRASAVAKVLITRKGLSKQMIGEYLGNIQNPFNMDVLHCFGEEIDLTGLQIDVALRKFQSHFRMPGEAQKIERLMEAFANRYVECNHDQVKQFSSADTVFLLAFAIIMLNTDLHNKSIRPDRKMKLTDFIKNLRGIDGGEDVDPDILSGIYTRIKSSEFKPGTDQVSQVYKVEQMIMGKRPQLSLPHRRLVCYCRLYEVTDPNKREKLGLHQREVFLFNDLLMVTKIFSKKKKHVSYSFRVSFPLCGMQVYLFETSHYKHGIRLTTNIDGKVLITFNARNEHDRSKFVEDLKEAILEMNEMESMRIDDELHKQKMTSNHLSFNRFSKDSGVVDLDLLRPGDATINRLSAPECSGLKKSTLSNSLIELSENSMRRGSGGSLDSGLMSAAPSASSDSHNGSQEDTQKTLKPQTNSSSSRFSIFGKKSKSSKSSLAADCSEA